MKISGDEIKVVEEKPKRKVGDLMNALQASLDTGAASKSPQKKKASSRKKKVAK